MRRAGQRVRGIVHPAVAAKAMNGPAAGRQGFRMAWMARGTGDLPALPGQGFGQCLGGIAEPEAKQSVSHPRLP